MGHRVDGGQNGGMSATELHNGSMRPLTQRHTQLAFAFAIWNPTSQTAMKRNIFMLTATPTSSCTHGGVKRLNLNCSPEFIGADGPVFDR